MRDSSLSAFASFVCLFAIAGCDAGSDLDESMNDGGNTATSTSTSTTSTSTTGGGSAGPGGGQVYNTGTGCTTGTLSATGTLYGQWEWLKFSINDQQYIMQVNEWNSTASQQMDYGGSFLFKMIVQQASAPTNGAPVGYPSVFIGANSSKQTENSNLPKQVSSIASLPTNWVWSDAGTLADRNANSYNASYDVWFSTNPSGEPEGSHPSGAFLMVWYHKPFDAQPIGSIRDPAVTITGVPGTWDVWIGTNVGTPVISYTATETISSMDFDLNAFIRDAVSRGGTVQDSHYLTNVFAGFEIWRGGVGLETTSFCAQVL